MFQSLKFLCYVRNESGAHSSKGGRLCGDAGCTGGLDSFLLVSAWSAQIAGWSFQGHQSVVAY